VETLPKELNEILNSAEFDDEAGILIESVTFIGEDLHLIFSIRFDGDISHQLWKVIINDIEDEQITRNWTQSIGIYEEHPLLLEYIDTHTELYFNGASNNWQELFIDIFQSLMSMVDSINDISSYLFSTERINELSLQNYGLFARGPKTILRIYEQCLLKQGIKPIYIGEVEPTSKNKSLKLLKLGDSHFIGQNFQFERK